MPPWFDGFIEIATLLLSWPITVLAIVVIIVCAFDNEIRRVLLSIKSINTPYGSVELSEEASSTKEYVAQATIKSQDQKIDPMPQYLMNRATTLAKQSRTDEAISVLLEVNQMMPNQLVVLHNLGALLIRRGKATKRIEYFVQAEAICKSALSLGATFPYGTLYNLARAQAAMEDTQGLKETFLKLSVVALPENLAKALIEGDGDFEEYEKVKVLEEYKDLRKVLTKKHSK